MPINYEPASVDGIHQKFHQVLDAHDQIQEDQARAAAEAKTAAEDRKLEARLNKQKQEEEEALQKLADEKQKQSEKAAEAAAKKAEEAAANALASEPNAKARPTPKRKKKKEPKEDIFRDFGKEHDDAPIQEIEVNGKVVHRLNYKRYYQSDKDLKRWGKSLDSHTRYERLLFKVRDRWHEDLTGDRLELKIQHNALVRSRHAEMSQKPASSASVALQLRELQKQIGPKDNKKKKFGAGKLAEPGFLGGFGTAQRDDGDDFLETVTHQATEEEMVAPSVAPTARSTGPDSVLDSPSSHSRRRPSEHESARPPQEMMTSASAPSLVRGQSQSNVPKYAAEMPSTMSLLLFRNADRLHTGETLFIKRWPPAGGLKELLDVATNEIKPVLKAYTGLYDNELNPVRSLEEVVTGGVYLLKGLEAWDPPKLFFNHDHIKDGSLRKLKRVKDVIAAEQDPLESFSQVPSHASTMTKVALYGEREPCPDSPPWGSRPLPPKPPKSEKWHVDEFLGMKLSWSGQGIPHQHHKFEQWKPVLQTAWRLEPRASIDRHGSATR